MHDADILFWQLNEFVTFHYTNVQFKVAVIWWLSVSQSDSLKFGVRYGAYQL